MYTKVTHYVKPYETQSVSTSDLNNIFDEEINPSERKEYDNVSNFCYWRYYFFRIFIKKMSK